MPFYAEIPFYLLLAVVLAVYWFLALLNYTLLVFGKFMLFKLLVFAELAVTAFFIVECC